MSSPSHSRMDSVRICSSSSLRFLTSWHWAWAGKQTQGRSQTSHQLILSEDTWGEKVPCMLTDRFLKEAMHLWMSGRSGWLSCRQTRGGYEASAIKEGLRNVSGYGPPCASPALWVKWGICPASWRAYWGLWSAWGSLDCRHLSPPWTPPALRCRTRGKQTGT